LGLLGEPGIGKTHTMKAQREGIDAELEQEGDKTLWLDLRSYGNEDRLLRQLFGNPTFVSWSKGSHRLQIFLDSLDECLLRIDNVAALLIDEFKNYPIERLYLRIACRTAHWPNTLEDGLRQLWGNDAMAVYELTPLRRLDVAEAARANGLNVVEFLAEIDRMEVVPLAIKPVTLGFLINTYHKTRQLPPTQSELYLEGCRLLCEETSESRRDARRTGNYSAKQRMAVASRIAAVTVFANRFAIWTGVDRGDVPDEDVTVQELSGGREAVNGEEFEVSELTFKETLDTGLFSSRGINRMGWAHQTYAEFLAARYLVESKMTLPKMMSLIVHPADPDGKLVPQLYEVAAWMAGMVPDVFREIMKTDPQVLLRSDVATADVKDRATLVETLMRLYDEEKLLDRDQEIRGRYGKLNYPGLAAQLRPYICDSSKGNIVRRVAIDIAEACGLQTLQGSLADIVLDSSQPIKIREDAASAVVRIGDDDTKAKLKPLAMGEAEDDPNDELKGCSLHGVWPAHMTAEELFSTLTHPERENFIGTYQLFLSHHLVKHLQPSDLPAALKWVENQQPKQEPPYSFKKLMDAIMWLAWEHLDSPGVLEAFAGAALSRLKHHVEIVGDFGDKEFKEFREVLINDDMKRRQVLEAMVPMLSDPVKDSIWLVHSGTPVALSRDVPWMIECLKAVESKDAQQAWTQLIAKAFDWREPGQLDVVFPATQDCPILGEAFAWLFEPVELGSPKAQKMKADYEKTQEWERHHQNRPPLDPSPAERIASLLNAFESGDSAAWWHLNMDMTLEPNSTHYGDEFESDLTVLPGWKAADASTRERIVEAAKRYVLEGEPESHKWLGKNILHRPALAGYRALRLLLQEPPGLIRVIPSEVWKKWAPIILAYPTSSAEAQATQRTLVKMAYQHAPDEIIKTLLLLIDKENREHSAIFVTNAVEDCWDERLANALLTKVKDQTLKPDCMRSLLGDLFDHGVAEAKSFAESLIPLPPPLNGEERAKVIVAARALMNYADDAGWSVVWPAIQQDAEFGREIIEGVAHRSDRDASTIGPRLTEDQLADFYIWLVRQYPYAEDPKHEGGHWVGPRESIAHFKNSVLEQLKRRGTKRGCEAIGRISRNFPQLEWLKWVLLDAQNLMRRQTWAPPQPVDILKLASDRRTHLVQNGDQLLDLLIESLKRLETELQGSTPAVVFLWNEICRNVYRPKRETIFSDYVKIHLEKDIGQKGVIVNREVEIRRGKTDIHVDAVIPKSKREGFDSVRAIIESKGSWNKELDHAMKTQLVDRYLKKTLCQHGLYLIGWFNCDKWDDSDYKKLQTPKMCINEAQKKFEVQAAKVSQGGLRIKALVIDTALR